MDKKQLDWFEKELQTSGSEWKICCFQVISRTGQTVDLGMFRRLEKKTQRTTPKKQ